MKRTFLSLSIIVLACCQSWAMPRTRQQAHQIASRLLDKPQALAVSPSLYIYNNEEKPGFVIVSSSDLVRPVIGYSDTGTIDPDNMPTNMKNWLMWVEEATAWLESHPECQLTESQMGSSSVIAPILGDIAWGQDSPFNDKCPTGTPAGCIATAAAQCVYYHRYPTSGVGKHTNSNNSSQTVDFSKATYDYSLMFDRYQGANAHTSAQLNEVAELTYHCGVMSDMYYASDGSSSSIVALRRGLVENLNYDPYCQVVYRSTRTLPEWQDYLLTELEASRPVIMTGNCNNNTGGHCFIIDGLNSEGLYHVNWGWNGSYDGYYDVTILNPEGTGIGATMSDDGFCSTQSILAQLAPKGKLTNPVYITPLCATSGSLNISSSSVNLGSSTTFSVSPVYNFSTDDVTGKVGLAFVQNGKIVKTAMYTGGVIRAAGSVDGKIYGVNLSGIQVTLPTTLSDGDYKVYACFVPTSGDFENECGLIYCKATAPSYYKCTISGGKASFSKGSYAINISANDWSFDSQSLTTSIKQTIACNITNNNEENTFVGKYYLRVTSPSNQTEYIEADQPITLAPLASGKLTFHTTFTEEGTWKSQLYVFRQNIDTDTSTGKKAISGTVKSFTVEKNFTTGAKFSLLATPTQVKNENYGDSLFIGSPASFTVQIKNSGEEYRGQFRMQLFKSNTSTIVVGAITSDVIVPANSEETYTITGNLEQIAATFNAAASGTNYYAKAYYDYAGTFKTLPVASGVSNRMIVRVYAGSPATGIEEVHADQSDNAVVYDLFGRRTSSQSRGLFIRNGKMILQK